MKNTYLPESILRSLESLAEATRPYQEAMDVLKHNTDVLSAFGDPLASKLGLMNGVLKKGIFDDNLSKSISALLVPYNEIAGAQAAINALGSSFQPLLKPEVYTSISSMTSAFSKIARPLDDLTAMQSTLESLIQATKIVDTSWLKNSSAWLVEKRILSDLDVGSLSRLSSEFSICRKSLLVRHRKLLLLRQL